MSTPLTPAVGDFVAQIEALLDASDWPALDRAAVTVTAGDASALVVLPHRRDPRLNVEVEIDDLQVKIAYGPERVPFTRRDEALRFLEMLGSRARRARRATQPGMDVAAQLPRRARAPVPQDERTVAEPTVPHRTLPLRLCLNAGQLASTWDSGAILTPGPIVDDVVTALRYLPLAAAGLARTISSSTAP